MRRLLAENASPTANHCVERRDQRLREPEREHQLRAGHQKLQLLASEDEGKEETPYLGHQALEEAGGTFVPGHVRQDPESALRIVKVAVLDPGLDDVQGRRHDQGRGCSGDGGDKVLEPRRLVVVLKPEEELLGEG